MSKNKKKLNDPLNISKSEILDLIETTLTRSGVSYKLRNVLLNRIVEGLEIYPGDSVEQEFAYELLYAFRHLLQHGIEHFGARPGRKFEPVDIETFVCSSDYMGQAEFVRPAILSELKRLFEPDRNKYHEVVLCLRGDTELVMGDGTTPTIKELSESEKAKGPFWIWAYAGKTPKLVHGYNARMTQKKARLYRATFEDGTFVEGTKEHIFFVDGEETKLQDLKEGDSVTSMKGQYRNVPKTNHKILKVEALDIYEPVYCLTVPETSNFFIQVKNNESSKYAINSVLSKNSGGIGAGKNYFADMALAYLIYDISSYHSPQLEFGLAPGSSIVLMMQSASIKLAKSVLYNQFKARISLNPYFNKNFPYDKKVKTELRFPCGVIIMPLSSTDTAALGLNVWGGIIDEMSFLSVISGSKKIGREGRVYDQAATLYNTVKRRMESRFMVLGKIPGKLFLVGSANYPGNFIDRKIQETELRIIGGEEVTTFVMNMAQWESLPRNRFSGETFKIEMPSENTHGKIVETADEPTLGAEIKEVPVEYKESFEEDFDGSLRDIAGVPVGSISKFIRNIEKITLAANKHTDIFEGNQLFISDTIDQRKIHTSESMINMDYLTNHLDPTTRMGGHIDLALTGDSLGLAIGRVFGFTRSKSQDPLSTVEETLPIFCIDGAASIVPTPNREIDLFAVRDLILFLKKHINIVFITMDSYESAMMLQSFRTNRISSTVQSVDRTTQPYKDLKTAILTERIMYPNSPVLLKEIKSLIHDPRTDKIDHPPHGRGSKDISDCVAAIIHRFSTRRTSYRTDGQSGGRPVNAGNRPQGSGNRLKDTDSRRIRTNNSGRLI